MSKSPFLIVKNFISPLECEAMVDSANRNFPNTDINNKPIKTIVKLPVYERRVWERLSEFFDNIEKYHNVEIDSLSGMDVEWYPAKSTQEGTRCENSKYFTKEWKIINDYDFTVVVFLKDSNMTRAFDEDFECYGGKLEMVNHRFGFNPERGTAIIFPSNQYFLNATVPPLLGDLFQLRLHIICDKRFKYSPQNYQGDHSVWFKGA